MRKPTDEMDISDFEFDQYLEGDSSLSQAYKSAASAIEPSVNVEKIVFNELDSISNSSVQIPRLVSPGGARKVKKQRTGYRFGWLGPVMGATCVAVLAVGLGLRANLFESPEAFETLASNESSEQVQADSVGADETLINTAVRSSDDDQLMAQVDSAALDDEATLRTQSRQATGDSFSVSDTAGAVASDTTVASTPSADNEVADLASDSGQPALRTESMEEPEQLIETRPEPQSSAQLTARSASAQDSQQRPSVAEQPAKPMVMAPADAVLEADGPRTPAVLDSDSLLEGDQERVSSSVAEATATGVGGMSKRLDPPQSNDDSTDSQALAEADAAPADVAAGAVTDSANPDDLDDLNEQQLAQALEQTEKQAETLETKNSELRDRLAALEEQVFNATNMAQTDTTQLQQTDEPVDNSMQVTDRVLLDEAKADLRLALNTTPSQSEQGRRLAQLSGDEIRQLLTSAADRESYRNALLSVIGEAGRSGQTERLQTLLNVYGQLYPEAPQPTPDLLQ